MLGVCSSLVREMKKKHAIMQNIVTQAENVARPTNWNRFITKIAAKVTLAKEKQTIRNCLFFFFLFNDVISEPYAFRTSANSSVKTLAIKFDYDGMSMGMKTPFSHLPDSYLSKDLTFANSCLGLYPVTLSTN